MKFHRTSNKSLMGFSNKCIMMIMKCISTFTYIVLINGTQCGNISPSRGIKQGDLLSRFLFIIGTKILVHLVDQTERNKQISGLKVTASSPPITHLLFADDNLFFYKAKTRCKQSQENYGFIL